MFSVTIEVGDPQGQRFERVEAVVDSGASYSQLPSSSLRRLGVEPHTKRRFVMADGRREESEIGRTWVRLDGRTEITIVVFAEENTQPLLGAVTLQELGFGIDMVNEKLIPIDGYRLHRRESL